MRTTVGRATIYQGDCREVLASLPTKTDSTGWAPLTRGTNEWRQTCACPAAEPIPATVLDPFAGAGTTLLVADRLQRSAIGIELNPDYVTMSVNRIRGDAPLFAAAPG